MAPHMTWVLAYYYLQVTLESRTSASQEIFSIATAFVWSWVRIKIYLPIFISPLNNWAFVRRLWKNLLHCLILWHLGESKQIVQQTRSELKKSLMILPVRAGVCVCPYKWSVTGRDMLSCVFSMWQEAALELRCWSKAAEQVISFGFKCSWW